MTKRKKNQIAGRDHHEPQWQDAGEAEGAINPAHPSERLPPPPPITEIAGHAVDEPHARPAGEAEGATDAMRPKNLVPPPPPITEIAGHFQAERQKPAAGEAEGAKEAVLAIAGLPSPPLNPEIAGQPSREPQMASAGEVEGAKVALHPSGPVPPPPTNPEIAGHEGCEHHMESAGEAEGANVSVHPTLAVPSPPPIPEIAGRASREPQPRAAGEAEGAPAFPPPPPHIAELIEWQRRRSHAIRSQSQCDRSCDSYVARFLGYHSGLTKTEGKAIFAEAAGLRMQVEKDLKKRKNAVAGYDNPALVSCLPIVVNSIQSRSAWDVLREDAEREMRRIARDLPVWSRCQSVEGFAELGLAVIVAEAGNSLSTYAHWYKLWKRLGLAPYNGKAVSSYPKQSLTGDEWTEAGYSPSRRGRIAGDVGTPLFFHKSKNDYGGAYLARREVTALTHPEWTKRHSDNDGRRIMTKALIKDLWRWWHAAEVSAAGRQDEAA